MIGMLISAGVFILLCLTPTIGLAVAVVMLRGQGLISDEDVTSIMQAAQRGDML